MANKDEIRYTISVDTESGTASVRNLKGQLVATQVPVKQLTAEFGKLGKTINATNFNKFNSEIRKTGNAVAQMKSKSGGATSAVLELGRVVQDAPYGLRGMANNITQLASQMAFATKSAGGFGKALKEMGKAMTGPLGVVFLISLVVSAMEMLQGSIGKTEKDLDKLTDASVTNAVSELTTLKNIIEDTSISLERKQEAIRLANEEYSELNISIDGTAESAIQALTALDLLIDKFSDVAYANAITELQVEAMKELANANRNAEGSFGDLFSSFEAFALGMQSFRLGGNAFDMAKQVNIAGIEQDLKEIEDLFKQPTKADPNLTYAELIFGKKDTKGGGRSRADRVFKEQILNLDKFILNQKRSLEKSRERNVMNLLEIDQRYAREDLKLTLETFNTKQQLRFDQWAEQEAIRQKMSIEEFRQTEKYGEELLKLQKSLADADAEYKVAVDNQKLAQEAETQRKRLEITEKFNDLILKANLKSAQAEAKMFKGMYDGTNAGSLGSPQSKVGADGLSEQLINEERLMAKEKADFEKTSARKLKDLMNRGFLLADAEAIIAEDRFQFQTDMVARELELEQMKVDSKKSINQEYVSWISGLGDVFKNIAGENEALAMVGLALEKGSAIADIIIKTQSANASVIANSSKASAGYEAAAAQQASLFNPVGSAFYKAQAIQAIASGKTRVTKNNIGAGISIAKIASTTLQSRSLGGSGASSAGASGGGGRTFDFNLVGSTGENQLAQGIAGQLGNPVQAYVVSSQMTSQQQLDNAIQTSATIGD